MSAVPEGVWRLLRSGRVEVLGLIPYSSNVTLLTRVEDEDGEILAVYKPRRGERPLWDFPDGTLCHREYAAWLIDDALGWSLVPPTVLRDGPHGFGALQLWIDEDPEVDVRALADTHPQALRTVAAFDVIANNADRKAGHLLVDRSGHLWSVDHGICFAAEPKLRTVVWLYEGEPVPRGLLEAAERLRASKDVFAALGEHLAPRETEALCRRLEALLASGRYPSPPPGGHNVPWPPW